METNISQLEEEIALYEQEQTIDSEVYHNFDIESLDVPQEFINEEARPEKFETEFGSIIDVVENAKLSPEWKNAENNANERQVVLKWSTKELVYQNEDGTETSFTQELAGTEYEQEHLELLNDLFEKGYAFSSLVDPLSGKEFITAYFADESGNVTTASFEREFEKNGLDEIEEESNQEQEAYSEHPSILKSDLSPIIEGLNPESEIPNLNITIEAEAYENIEESKNTALETDLNLDIDIFDTEEEEKVVEEALPLTFEKTTIFIPQPESPKIEKQEEKEIAEVIESKNLEQPANLFDLFTINLEPLKTSGVVKKVMAEDALKIETTTETISSEASINSEPDLTTSDRVINVTATEFGKTTEATAQIISEINSELKFSETIVSAPIISLEAMPKEISLEKQTGIYLEFITAQDISNQESDFITPEEIITKTTNRTFETQLKLSKLNSKIKVIPEIKKEILKPIFQHEVKMKEVEVTEDQIIEQEDFQLQEIINLVEKTAKVDTQDTITAAQNNTENQIQDSELAEEAIVENIDENLIAIPEILKPEQITEKKFNSVTEEQIKTSKEILPTKNGNELLNNNQTNIYNNSIIDETALEELNGIKIERLVA